VQMLVGLALGYLGGLGARWLAWRVRLEWPSLYPVFMVVSALFVFACTNWAGGSGFLAAYVAGLVLGNGQLPFKPLISRFLDGTSWLMQIVMFVLLGLLVFPSRLLNVTAPAIALGLFLMLAARPLVTWTLLVRSGLSFLERTMVAWAGLRGAVPIILAIYPLTQGVERGHTIFNIVFFVVILSVLLQGTTMGWVARRLRLHLPAQLVPALQVELASWQVLDGEIVLFRVEKGTEVDGKALRELPLPQDALAMLLVRGEELVTPRGSTALRSGDTVYFIVKAKDKATLERLFAGGL
jgi:cell volume regulation protein A